VARWAGAVGPAGCGSVNRSAGACSFAFRGPADGVVAKLNLAVSRGLYAMRRRGLASVDKEPLTACVFCRAEGDHSCWFSSDVAESTLSAGAGKGVGRGSARV